MKLSTSRFPGLFFPEALFCSAKAIWWFLSLRLYIEYQKRQRSLQIIEKARENAKAVEDSAYAYADNLLETVEKVVVSSMKDMEQCVAIVRNNRSELKNTDVSPTVVE